MYSRPSHTPWQVESITLYTKVHNYVEHMWYDVDITSICDKLRLCPVMILDLHKHHPMDPSQHNIAEGLYNPLKQKVSPQALELRLVDLRTRRLLKHVSRLILALHNRNVWRLTYKFYLTKTVICHWVVLRALFYFKAYTMHLIKGRNQCNHLCMVKAVMAVCY